MGADVFEFQGEHRFLSNFFPVPGGVILLDDQPPIQYPTVEHAFVAAKTMDRALRHTIWMARTPGDAKHMGRTLTLRKYWDGMRVGVMLKLLYQKFLVPALREKLLATGDAELVEGNHWHDNFWGSCNCMRCKVDRATVLPEPLRTGQNQLGNLLMLVREDLRSQATRGL